MRDLYLAFKDFGRNPIVELGKRLEIGEDGELSFVHPQHDGSLDSYFEKVWGVYGGKTGIQLSNMTHRKGEPWTIVAKKYHYDLSDKPIIPSEIIRDSFAKRVQTRSGQ